MQEVNGLYMYINVLFGVKINETDERLPLKQELFHKGRHNDVLHNFRAENNSIQIP